MIKILGFILTIGGAIALVIGLLGVFGSMNVGLSPWALLILGIIFFFAGIGLLKKRKDTDTIDKENN
ncbi:hypothetical protein INR76_07485 [Marixanthomonas sp. SCSIO 43207]|uniref:hypothetical protein n=1 Tax=Marixanthomonas sp. SCSIO 43207 TaxID=2779360 RepID=UPI001CA9E22E|nr:hypothetical protein [Marixanthomonas sp. SCSIO 43207]UAB79982.1 hypothetical protein INR76_07485 [Marixanthomonas sp. SCSIO 43207]